MCVTPMTKGRNPNEVVFLKHSQGLHQEQKTLLNNQLYTLIQIKREDGSLIYLTLLVSLLDCIFPIEKQCLTKLWSPTIILGTFVQSKRKFNKP